MARVFQVARRSAPWPVGKPGFGRGGGALALGWALLGGLCLAAHGADPPGPPASLSISGLGFWQNRAMVKTLRLLQAEETPPAHFDATEIEDAALLLLSTLREEGYLRAGLAAVVTREDGATQSLAWPPGAHPEVPRPLRARAVHFRVTRGPLYFYRAIEFAGLRAVDAETARRFFAGADFLLRGRKTRVYTPSRQARGVAGLRDELQRRGYADAEVRVGDFQQDDQSGAVRVRFEVQEGRRHWVRSVRREVFFPDEVEPRETTVDHPAVPYSRFWQQDYAQALQRDRYHEGFPDTRVEISVLNRETVGESVQVDLLARVHTGPRVRLAEVRFPGADRTAPWLLRRRVRLEPGQWLDRVAAEQGRFRLARLGTFDRVGLQYEDAGEAGRAVVYPLREGKTLDLSVLFGYGSYELLRGGVEVERRNLFGLAQHARLRATQSFKATSGDLFYSMPELVGRDVDLFLNGSFLRREEISFTRLEYGGGAGAQRFFPSLHTDASIRYNYQILNANDAPVGPVARDESAAVSAWVLSLKHDRRDNPLNPRSGHKLTLTLEHASPAFGGEANYQRVEVGGTWHQPLGGGRYLHLALEHGVAWRLSAARDDLPFNKRFFPGGESSVRGYQLGEASPRNEQGKLVGAETFLQGNVELEQVLTPAWSIVGFIDGIGVARELRDYPFRETLFSVGGGIRWRTVIGPVRLEYGHNLDPRPGDPPGTLHLSIGFPF